MSSIDEKILENLEEIKLLTRLMAQTQLDEILLNIATTEDRKKIWALLNGVRDSQEIADSINISKRSVDRFLKLAESVGLANNPWGRPASRKIDYVPTTWLQKVLDIEEE